MPTYQYTCPSCSHGFEIAQSFSDDPLTDCPACSSTGLRKVYGSVGVVFKGSGFYRNDSRSSDKKSGKPSSAGATSAPAGGDSTAGRASGAKKAESGAAAPAAKKASATD